MTNTRIVRIEEVLLHLGIEDDEMLRRLREVGLFEADEIDPQGADEFRVAALMMEELGVNPAGVQVALHLRRRLMTLESRTTVLMGQLSRDDRRKVVADRDPD